MRLVTAAEEGRSKPAPEVPERRLHPRAYGMWNGLVLTVKGPYRCSVLDLSRGGARLQLSERLNGHQTVFGLGEPVTLMIATVGMLRGEVVWTQDDTSGIRFVEPLGDIAQMIGAS
jgi:hypothetical protein